MDSPAATRALTAASISLALREPSVGSAVPETMGTDRACSGKSHSKLTPWRSSPRPSAKTISVADGSSETILTGSPPQSAAARLDEVDLWLEHGSPGGPAQRRQHRSAEHEDQDGARRGAGQVEAHRGGQVEEEEPVQVGDRPGPGTKE